MNPTPEQREIIDCEEDNLIIDAKAGSGKTSTLVEIAKKRPFNTFLYLAYNEPVKREAKGKFFGNTTVHTIHSLAYEHIGCFYVEKLTQNLSAKDIIKGSTILAEMQKEDPRNQDIYTLSSGAADLLNAFFNSKEDSIDSFEENEVWSIANEYWNKMQDLSNKDVKMTHDGYLKLFQASKITLPFNYILVDEAQDSNEVMLDIVLRQKSKLIFVGDKHQEIYGFRRVTNIFKDKRFQSFKKLSLTKSFRFGAAVSYLANIILEEYTNEKVFVEGVSPVPDEIVHDVSVEKNYTIITRTNAHLFDLAVQKTLEGKRVSIIGGGSFEFDDLKDCYYLMRGQLFKMKNQYFKKMGSFLGMKDIARKTKDLEMSFLIKVVEKYGDDIINHIEMLERSLVNKNEYADVVLTTIHKSKGLEFFNVKLADDYYSLFTRDGKRKPPFSIPYEEINLYYVAITRAMEKIEMNTSLRRIA